MDAATIGTVVESIPCQGVVAALRTALPGDWFGKLDACVFVYLLRLLQGQTVKESYLAPAFVRDTLAAYLHEFDCCPTEAAAQEAAARAIEAMDKMGLSQAPEASSDNKLSAPLTMGRQYEETLRRANGGKATTSGSTNETWTWEGKEKQAKEQRRKRKEEEKKAMLKGEYEEFLQMRGLAQSSHQIIKVHDKGDDMSSAARASVEIRCHQVHLQMGKNLLIDNSDFTLLPAHRYGLVGRNGTGKTTLLRALAEGDLEGVSPFVQIVHVEQEITGDVASPIQTLLSTDVERDNLIKEEKELLKRTDDSTARLAAVYTRLDDIDAHSAEARAAAILSGLSFTHEMMNQPTNRLSGGWRMRVALARALFVEPDILLLDEPTNHLDLHAVLWLEQFLLRWPKTLVVVSHSRSFLNNVCPEMVHLNNKKLDYYDGNYDQFEITRNDRLKNQAKQYETQQKEREHMMAFVNKFRASAARATMAQSRLKALERMELIAPVVGEHGIEFKFKQPDDVSGPMIQIIDCEFGYKAGQVLFKDINFSLDAQSRVALVGANGAGKTTFMKMLLGELEPKRGAVVRNPKIRIGHFAQHHLEHLTPQQTALEFMRSKFPDQEEGQLRGQLSAFGLYGDQQLQPIYTLSGGQKSRVAFAWITFTRPHLLLLDEPTNHLDIDTVTALLQALMAYAGGLLVVSHDESFIGPLCDSLYVTGGGAMRKYDGDFEQYRSEIARSIKI